MKLSRNTFSFNILLNDADGFEGGGTYFNTPVSLVEWDDGGESLLSHSSDEIGKCRTSEVSLARGQRGDCLMHCGQLLHGGCTVTHGTRFILVGFVAEHWEAD